MRVAKPTLAIAVCPRRDAIGTLRDGIRRFIEEVDHEHGTRRVVENTAGHASESPFAVRPKPADDQQLGADFRGEVCDFFMRLPDPHVEPRAPLIAVKHLERWQYLRGEPLFDLFEVDFVVVDDGYDVKLRRIVPSGLIDRVFQHDFRIFGAVISNDNSKSPRRHSLVRHTDSRCIRCAS